MFSNSSALVSTSDTIYPISDGSLPFAEYINQCRTLIQERRMDLNSSKANIIVNANSPYELRPLEPVSMQDDAQVSTAKRFKYGAILIHGLLDCPFSLLDIGRNLQANGMLCRSVLLPGHGTTPSDLLKVSYLDWIQTVRYATETMHQEVDQIFLIGYSTGASLSLYQAIHDSRVAGVIMLAPAIKIKAPIGLLVGWHQFLKYFNQKSEWFYRNKEIDYTKYISIPFNAITQLAKLMQQVDELQPHKNLTCPTFTIVSREDETISGSSAIDFFLKSYNKKNRLLIYAAHEQHFRNPNITVRGSQYSGLNIKNFSHVSIPFAPNNPHYGQHGDYPAASYDDHHYLYGAYNHVEAIASEFLKKFGLMRYKRRELSYNPDFTYTADRIREFIFSSS